MDFMDSLKFVIFSQQIYRLAAFRFDKSRTKLMTDNKELFFSVFYVSLISAEVGYIGWKAYSFPAENFFKINVGKF